MVYYEMLHDGEIYYELIPGKPERFSLTLIPPGPVSNKTDVEIRLTIPNNEKNEKKFRVSFYVDKFDLNHLIENITVTVPPENFTLVKMWWKTNELLGRHKVLFRVLSEANIVAEGEWPIEVFPSNTTALPLLLGGWCDPGCLLQGSGYPMLRAPTEEDVKREIDSMKRIGMSVIIITYVEWNMRPFYPSKVFKQLQYLNFDVIEAILSQADENDMHVFLGLGRGDDLYLLWNGLDDPSRIKRAVNLGCRVAAELWERYHHHPSFYGWYLTHEANDLPKALAYYNSVADFCHSFAPDKPVMIAPAGNPIFDPEIIKNSHIDIFAPQDCVGTGYNYRTYQYTLDTELRLRDLPEVYASYKDKFRETGKHLWSDLEIWRANKTTGYTPFYPAPINEVIRQIEIESQYVEWITAYEFFSMMEFPESTLMLGGEEAVGLYSDYEKYYTKIMNSYNRSIIESEERKTVP